jgi:hypothetical protein
MEDNGQPTQFNMAIATLQAMDRVLWSVSLYATMRDYSNWYIHLLELRRNVAPFIKPERYAQIDLLLNELNSHRWLSKNKVIPSQIRFVDTTLDELTITIRRAMNEVGILMPKSDDPRLAIRG